MFDLPLKTTLLDPIEAEASPNQTLRPPLTVYEALHRPESDLDVLQYIDPTEFVPNTNRSLPPRLQWSVRHHLENASMAAVTHWRQLGKLVPVEGVVYLDAKVSAGWNILSKSVQGLPEDSV